MLMKHILRRWVSIELQQPNGKTAYKLFRTRFELRHCADSIAMRLLHACCPSVPYNFWIWWSVLTKHWRKSRSRKGHEVLIYMTWKPAGKYKRDIQIGCFFQKQLADFRLHRFCLAAVRQWLTLAQPRQATEHPALCWTMLQKTVGNCRGRRMWKSRTM